MPVPAAPAVPPAPRFSTDTFPPAARRSRLLQTLLVTRDPLGELQRARDLHGPVFTLRIFPYAGVICATDSATNKQVLADHSRFAAGDAADLLEPVIGSGSLILTPAPRHQRNRKLLMPPFQGQRAARWATLIQELVDQQLPALLTGETVAVRPWAQRLTLDVILRVVFGIDDPARRTEFRHALDALMAPSNQVLLFAPAKIRADLGPLSPGRSFQRKRRRVDELLLEEIERRRAEPDSVNRDDVLSVLLHARDEDGVGYTDDELRDELKGLVIAGHETTATALAWTLHLLALHPAATAALQADLAVGSTEYLSATIKESMRFRAPVWDAIRIATEDTELGGQPIPAGSYVSAMFCVTHLDDSSWPDAAEFRPERHLAAQTHDSWALTPFGGGARRCIGAALATIELEAVLTSVLSRATPEAVGGLEPTRLLGVTLVPAKGGRVRLVPRVPDRRP